MSVDAHDKNIFCLAFSPFFEFLLATGADDNVPFSRDFRILMCGICAN